ncbi:MAG: type II toxin-antitoxin system HicA family toxin [Oscillospiraceae bacterium]|nr:type II toxin-antitoxin system HicA family toxin [Oscillospiraceae bacterium]
MSKNQKLLKRLLSKPKDFTFDELKTLLSSLGYREHNAGKTSGSAVRFINERKHTIRIHKPHPSPILKNYLINMLIDELKKEGFVNE